MAVCSTTFMAGKGAGLHPAVREWRQCPERGIDGKADELLGSAGWQSSVLLAKKHGVDVAFGTVLGSRTPASRTEKAMLPRLGTVISNADVLRITGRVSRLLFLTGERDDAATITWDAEALLQRLQPLSAYGLKTRSAKFDNETHMTVLYRAITPTLRFAIGVP